MFGKNKNKKVGLCVMVVTAGLVLATPETSLAKKPAKPGGGGGNTDVSVTFRDDSADRVYSDGGGPYTRERGNKVKAYIGMAGALRLATWDSSVRSILLNIPFTLSGCPEGDFGHANLITLGEDTNGDGFLTEPQLDSGIGEHLNLLAMEEGSSKKAGLRILFPFLDPKKGDAWYVLFGEEDPDPADEFNLPLTDLVTVTRVSDSVWTIEAGADDLAMAALVRIDQEPRPRVPCTIVSMPFLITVEILP